MFSVFMRVLRDLRATRTTGEPLMYQMQYLRPRFTGAIAVETSHASHSWCVDHFAKACQRQYTW